MSTTLYAIVSSSPRVPSSSVALIAAALQKQMEEDLAPTWGGAPWTVAAYESKDAIPAPGDCWDRVVVYELVPTIPEAPDALAYHTEDEQGRVWGREGVDVILDGEGGTVLDGPASVSSAASHEMCETYCDEFVASWSMVASGAYLVATESADPVEGDAYAKTIAPSEAGAFSWHQAPDAAAKDVSVSNFVFPSYFDPYAQEGPYDQMDLVGAPGEIRPGGYQMQLSAGSDPQTGAPALVFQNVFGAKTTAAHRAKKRGSKRAVARASRAEEKLGARRHPGEVARDAQDVSELEAAAAAAVPATADTEPPAGG